MEFKNIHLGIAAESNTDAELMACFLRNILSKHNFRGTLNEKNIYSNETKIYEDSIEEISNFFEKQKEKIHILVITTDRDGNKKTESSLSVKIASVPWPQDVILVVPVEHLEAWLLQCTTALNSVLKPGKKFEKAGDGSRQKAKDIIADLIGTAIENNNYSGSKRDALLEIARKSNDAEIASDDYLEFKRRVIEVAKKIREQKAMLLVKKVKVTRLVTKPSKSKKRVTYHSGL